MPWPPPPAPLQGKLLTVSTIRAFVCSLLFAMLVTGLVIGLVLGISRAENVCLTVDLGYAKYRGANVKNGVSQWLGMRYAAPPLGDLRWRAPADPLVNTTLQPATARGGVCITSPSTAISDAVKNGVQKEDCLFVNVFAPTDNEGNLPVFINFQGGGLNNLADSTLDANDLINAADHGIVVVTSNYRVGLQGFLASKEIKANGDLNVGLLDQRKMLHWVQKNIHLFGGDPKHVTIGGGSAGGGSVSLHLTAYGGRDDGLFHAAAGESPSHGARYTVDEAQYQYDTIVKRVKCDTAADTLKCLRDLDINTLLLNNGPIVTPGGGGGPPAFPYSSVIDGTFTTDYAYNSYAKGKFVKVPTIYGSCTNEGTTFTPKDPTAFANQTDMDTFLKNNFPKLTPSHLSRAHSLYPVTPSNQYPNRGPYWSATALAYGELRYNCPSMFMSAALPHHGMNASWNYHWDWLSTANALSGDGVTHVAEGASIWGVNEKGNVPGNAIQKYWTSFIRTKNPNTLKAVGAPVWEVFLGGGEGKEGGQRVRFTNRTVGMEGPDEVTRERCGFWSGIGGVLGQ
ncbi:hypothetical protein HYFRA_00001233 [Hymenoscyphus fraxineus]|uniref:Carboxylic ester hydrolase n=1 Tax=Hymenoscyphus fraxineus TaxID=746836 RepID=A0A9N9KSU5_9HELO|nr:hypothetical protein HYFRA_00001233 [Hymenoscyphus fraxineus]